MHPDVLVLDQIGGAYSFSTLEQRGVGGSEIEVLQVAKGLTGRGYSVCVANGVEAPRLEGGVEFVPLKDAAAHTPTKALYLQRFSTAVAKLEIDPRTRVIVRANDMASDVYDVHRGILQSGRASLIANTPTQAQGFVYAKDRQVIPPMLEAMPTVAKVPGLFVFASGAQKGYDATIARWKALKRQHPAHLARTYLVVVSPGWGDFPVLTDEDRACGISFEAPTPDEYREWIAKAEGLFMVLTHQETFCCAAALAERAGTRTHILCLNGVGGIRDALIDSSLVTEDPVAFDREFLRQLGTAGTPSTVPDLSPDVLIDRWERALRLTGSSLEAEMPRDPRQDRNQEPLGAFFGDFLSQLRGALAPGGSEFGLGLMLFSLATAVKARTIVEIGRFKGFSTLALAAACRLQDIGWTECRAAEQRPDVDYRHSLTPARVVSIDPHPDPDAEALLYRAGVLSSVELVNQPSAAVEPPAAIDLLFLDGSHVLSDIRQDVRRYVPQVRAGGYFVLHDYFGWFDPQGRNGSPVKQIIEEELAGFDRVLIDTGYASCVLFQKTRELDPPLSVMPPRADGRPTVGAVLIAKGEEVSTVITRAVMSAKKVGVDCVTVVCDAAESAAEIVTALGAQVVRRPSPGIDWERGIGIIGRARNEALAIAESRAEYVLMLDADDYLEGTLPTVLDQDVYDLTIHDGQLRYGRGVLFRSARSFRYTGIVHEVLETHGTWGQCPDVIYHRGKSAYAFQDQDSAAVKFSKHAHWLQKWLLDHPEDARARFYYARSLHDAGRLPEAIVAYDQHIALAAGWHEERAYSAYQLGLIRMERGEDPTLALLRSHDLCPRAEPLVALARWYRDDTRKQFSTAYAFARRAAEIPMPQGGLFVLPRVYTWEAIAEWAICAYWLDRKQEALDLFSSLLSRVPPDQQAWLDNQIALCHRELR